MRALPTMVRRPLGHGRRSAMGAYRRATAGGRMLPTFLIIGVQKGGTTSLYELLAEHPDVGPAVEKEIHYFDNRHDRSLAWYRSHFSRRDEAAHTGEATPYYLFHPLCPRRVHSVLPEVKLIVLLRDPVDRAHSHHNHELALGHETLDFETALAREEERLRGEEERLIADPSYRSFAHQHYSYVSRGMYARQLERWLEHFPSEQLLVLASEQLFGDPAGTLHRVQDWLELSRHTPGTLAPRNARTYDPLGPELRAELAGLFESDLTRLRELTALDAPWAGTAAA